LQRLQSAGRAGRRRSEATTSIGATAKPPPTAAPPPGASELSAGGRTCGVGGLWRVLAAHAAGAARGDSLGEPRGGRVRGRRLPESLRGLQNAAELSGDRALLATRGVAVRVLRNATLRNAALPPGDLVAKRGVSLSSWLRNAAFHFQVGCETRRFTWLRNAFRLRNVSLCETRRFTLRRFTLRNAAFRKTRRFANFDLSFAKLCI